MDSWLEHEHYHGDNWTDTWRERNSGFVRQHNDDNSIDAWSKCKSGDEWRASHWETSSWSSSHWETSGWNDGDERSNDRKEQLRSSHSFFEAKSMNQLISSLCRGDDAAAFSGLRGSLPQVWTQTTCHPWRQPSCGLWRQSQGVGKD